ncbi:hypothetical protein DASB73_005650 [Starmerella bacillaris]|uniref:Uncharacterized protein n=1 Tax=Starmerella bacillaris TaxID=1247836 RepID=A0AAV5REF7_STABA|nr:hypothetical protein DASB73_005650 [Starmerella bacillaris]
METSNLSKEARVPKDTSQSTSCCSSLIMETLVFSTTALCFAFILDYFAQRLPLNLWYHKAPIDLRLYCWLRLLEGDPDALDEAQTANWTVVDKDTSNPRVTPNQVDRVLQEARLKAMEYHLRDNVQVNMPTHGEDGTILPLTEVHPNNSLAARVNTSFSSPILRHKAEKYGVQQNNKDTSKSVGQTHNEVKSSTIVSYNIFANGSSQSQLNSSKFNGIKSKYSNLITQEKGTFGLSIGKDINSTYLNVLKGSKEKTIIRMDQTSIKTQIDIRPEEGQTLTPDKQKIAEIKQHKYKDTLSANKITNCGPQTNSVPSDNSLPGGLELQPSGNLKAVHCDSESNNKTITYPRLRDHKKKIVEPCDKSLQPITNFDSRNLEALADTREDSETVESSRDLHAIESLNRTSNNQLKGYIQPQNKLNSAELIKPAQVIVATTKRNRLASSGVGLKVIQKRRLLSAKKRDAKQDKNKSEPISSRLSQSRPKSMSQANLKIELLRRSRLLIRGTDIRTLLSNTEGCGLTRVPSSDNLIKELDLPILKMSMPLTVQRLKHTIHLKGLEDIVQHLLLSHTTHEQRVYKKRRCGNYFKPLAERLLWVLTVEDYAKQQLSADMKCAFLARVRKILLQCMDFLVYYKTKNVEFKRFVYYHRGSIDLIPLDGPGAIRKWRKYTVQCLILLSFVTDLNPPEGLQISLTPSKSGEPNDPKKLIGTKEVKGPLIPRRTDKSMNSVHHTGLQTRMNTDGTFVMRT